MVIISNGNSKFILGTAAAEAYKRGLLDAFITAGYPNWVIKRFLRGSLLTHRAAVRRLFDREEAIPIELVHPIWSSEFFDQAAGIFRRFAVTQKIAEYLNLMALKSYAATSVGIIRSLQGQIYHYRSGYGGKSVADAKRRGLITLCDHSIVHPAVLDYLVNNGGSLPPEGTAGHINRFWTCVLEDLNQCDHVVVNSDFVKETFLHQGWAIDRVHVAYTGIDDAFMENVVQQMRNLVDSSQPLRLLFAGEFGPRKGAAVLIEALERISDIPWQMKIAGAIHLDIARANKNFLRDPRVTILGFVSQSKLAEHMSQTDVFVFPSLAEGSARVLFQALACGCYVVTTPNSGSIVVNGVHGDLVPPGDANAIEASLRRIATDRGRLDYTRAANTKLMTTSYRQSNYGDALAIIYRKIAGDR